MSVNAGGLWREEGRTGHLANIARATDPSNLGHLLLMLMLTLSWPRLILQGSLPILSNFSVYPNYVGLRKRRVKMVMICIESCRICRVAAVSPALFTGPLSRASATHCPRSNGCRCLTSARGTASNSASSPTTINARVGCSHSCPISPGFRSATSRPNSSREFQCICVSSINAFTISRHMQHVDFHST